MQGRGSAANSVVCYALGITAVDPVGMDLLFERFLSEERGEWPDIDLDLPSGEQREKAIQYVYQRYGELGAAMTANVITYRGRSAAREAGKALGFDAETLNRLTKLVSAWEWKDKDDTLGRNFQDAGFDIQHRRIAKYVELCERMQDLPRHLGQHSGGMVICGGQLNAVRSDRAGLHAGAHGHSVGQGRLRRHEDHQGRSARAGHDGRTEGLPDAGARSITASRSIWRSFRRTIRQPIAHCKRPIPLACFRWRAARRWRRCRATIPPAFTISWCRWPSSVPAPSWAT